MSNFVAALKNSVKLEGLDKIPKKLLRLEQMLILVLFFMTISTFVQGLMYLCSFNSLLLFNSLITYSSCYGSFMKSCELDRDIEKCIRTIEYYEKLVEEHEEETKE